MTESLSDRVTLPGKPKDVSLSRGRLNLAIQAVAANVDPKNHWRSLAARLMLNEQTHEFALPPKAADIRRPAGDIMTFAIQQDDCHLRHYFGAIYAFDHESMTQPYPVMMQNGNPMPTGITSRSESQAINRLLDRIADSVKAYCSMSQEEILQDTKRLHIPTEREKGRER